MSLKGVGNDIARPIKDLANRGSLGVSYDPTSNTSGDISSITLPNGEVLNNPYYGNKASAGFLKQLFYPGKVAQEQQAMDSQAKEWYASQVQALYADWYSSPEQESARLNAAGINPALSGVTGAQSSMSGNPGSGVDPIVGDSPIGAGDIINTVGSLFSICTSLVKQGFDIASLSEGLKSQKLANTKEVQDIAANDLLHEVGVDLAKRGAVDSDVFDENYILGLTIPHRSVKGRAGKTSKLSNQRHDGRSRGWTRQMTNAYNEAISRFGSSAKTKGELYKVLQDYQTNRKGFLTSVSGGVFSDRDSIMTKALDAITSAYESTLKSGYEAQDAKNSYDKTFYSKLDGALGASAQNAQNELTVNEKNDTNFQAEFFRNLMSDLKKASESKDATFWDKLLYVGAILLRSNVLGNLKLGK